MIQYYNSGFITFRNRKIGICFSGETAEHIMNNYINERSTHPLRHIRIQQLAKTINQWSKESTKRYSGVVNDNVTGVRLKIIIEIYTKSALIITCYMY
ncbi:MAG: hypothetical protein LC122_00840 [Chitinophagales bacterium]|nr:hypothetical protein [Chitinophagales bacterium]